MPCNIWSAKTDNIWKEQLCRLTKRTIFPAFGKHLDYRHNWEGCNMVLQRTAFVSCSKKHIMVSHEQIYVLHILYAPPSATITYFEDFTRSWL